MKATDSGTAIFLAVVVLLLVQLSVAPETVGRGSRPDVVPVVSASPDLENDPFVLVEGGTFQIGDLFADGNLAMEESPVHAVEVGDFLLARNEVTVSEFTDFLKATGYKPVIEIVRRGVRLSEAEIQAGKTYTPTWKSHYSDEHGNRPAVCLAWDDAMAYCNWLSRKNHLPPVYDEKTGKFLDGKGVPTTDVRQMAGFRLPTEAEWEFAARERGRKVRFGNGQDIARADQMNFDAAGTGATIPSLRLPASNCNPYNEPGMTRGKTTPVGSFPPNTLGLYDMSGNAWEWCLDTVSKYSTEKQVNPLATGGGSHLIRGGDFDTDAKACRVSARIDWPSGALCHGSGFRLARTAN